MRRSVFILIGSLMLAAPVGAQQRIDGEGFVWTIVAGPGITNGTAPTFCNRDPCGNGALLRVSLGGEYLSAIGLGVAGDVGYSHAIQDTIFLNGAGELSAGVIYRIPMRGRTKPFVRGGYTALVGFGIGHGLHFGGGVTHWFKPQLGLKVDARYVVPKDGTGWFSVAFGIAFQP